MACDNRRMLELAKRALRWLTGRAPEPPGDPYASVRHPVRRGPSPRSAAVALEEPPPRGRVNLYGLRMLGFRPR